jgi:predicted RNA binding protein YcfA (HicA-like mRNA interferase family)
MVSLTVRIFMRIITLMKHDELQTNSRKLIRLLQQDGFQLVKVVGSHHKLKKGDSIVTVPHPKKDLPIGTVRSIYKQAGWL